MAKSKEEIIKIQIGEEVIELTGSDKEAFLEQKTKDEENNKIQLEALQAQKELKISAYKKLGLTDEEIAAII